MIRFKINLNIIERNVYHIVDTRGAKGKRSVNCRNWREREREWKEMRGGTWKIHLLMMITVTLKAHHWRIAKRDLNTLHWQIRPSSITVRITQPDSGGLGAPGIARERVCNGGGGGSGSSCSTLRCDLPHSLCFFCCLQFTIPNVS